MQAYVCSYDRWKTTDPADAQYCRCGWHASDCAIVQAFGECPRHTHPRTDPEPEPEPELIRALADAGGFL